MPALHAKVNNNSLIPLNIHCSTFPNWLIILLSVVLFELGFKQVSKHNAFGWSVSCLFESIGTPI